MGEEWEKTLKKIVDLQGDFTKFKVDFFDGDNFRDFVENRWRSDLQDFPEFCLVGYFSETIRDKIEYLLNWHNVRIISQEFPKKLAKRDRKNLEVFKKLDAAGAKIKFNHRTHARMLIAYNPKANDKGLVLIGSFDFNSECIGKERYDAGIKSRHPDLVKSAINIFEQIWNEPESITLGEYLANEGK